MALTRDIVATYRGPGRTLRRLLDMGVRETFALSILMAGCVVVLIAQWPKLARDSYLSGEDIYFPLYGAFIAMIFVMPLVLYVLAALSHVILRAVGGKGVGYASRLALFWAFLASTPVLLLHAMVAGLIGEGGQLSAVGLVWLLVFLWFWSAGLKQAHWGSV